MDANLKKRTAQSFGFEWSKFADIYQAYGDNFLSSIEPIDKDFFKDKLVLDAGCGAGRYSWFAAQWGAKVIGIDISEKAIAVARENLIGLDASVISSDIYSFDYPQKFDYIFTIGVLHHLSDPQAGFNKLVSLLKSGGTISIWVYSQENNKLARYLYEPLRKITTKIPHQLLYMLALIPALGVEVCNRIKLPIFRQYIPFPFKTKWNDAFDMMSAPSAKYYSKKDILKWFNALPFEYSQVRYRVINGVVKGIIGHGEK